MAPVLLRVLSLASLVAIAELWPALAQAQIIEPLTAASFSRDTEMRSTQERPFWINREDCLADDYLHFRMKVRSPTNDNFQVWIGQTTDCTSYAERTDDSGRCWRVLDQLAQDQSFDIDLPVRDIADRREGGNRIADGTEATCNQQWEGQIAIYFMYVDDSGDVLASTKWTQSGVDLEGPSPPSDVEARIADEALQAQWDPSNATDLLGYRIYCAPNGGSALGDAGASGDAGDTPAGGGDGTCGAAGLQQGALPGLDLQVCGESASKTARNGLARGLENGTEYAIAVAATDDIGNAGPLSNVTCGTPEPVETFYENYWGAGGQGGGGICGVATIGQTRRAVWGSLGLLFSGVALGAARARARMRRRR